jgi:hypothetical protein
MLHLIADNGSARCCSAPPAPLRALGSSLVTMPLFARGPLSPSARHRQQQVTVEKLSSKQVLAGWLTYNHALACRPGRILPYSRLSTARQIRKPIVTRAAGDIDKYSEGMMEKV